MNLFIFELTKLLRKRFSLILLLVTVVSFPVLIKIAAHLGSTSDGIPEGLFADKVAFSIFAYSQSYFFLPVWVIIFTGMEIVNGHVNRVTFIRSRTYYFNAKLVYCGIVTALFTLLALASLSISISTSSYQTLTVSLSYYTAFIVQYAIVTACYTLLLLCIALTFRSPMVSFVVYLGWTFVESTLYAVAKGFYHIEFNFLPFQSVRNLYRVSEDVATSAYHNPVFTDPVTFIVPVAIVLIFVLGVRTLFLKRELTVLSD